MRVADPVVITGMGAVSAAGWSADETEQAFATGRIPRSEIALSAVYHRKNSARTAFLVDDAGLGDWITPMSARRMCRPSRFAVAAAKMALANAGLESSPINSAAVFLSTSYGPSAFTEKIIRQGFSDGPMATSPALFSESVVNAPAAQIALALGAGGANVTITQRQAGPLMAVMRGAVAIAAGKTLVALVGAVDEVTPVLHGILDRFGALARPACGREETARPLDRHRDGFVAGEGSTVLVLESERSAVQRGASILARVVAGGRGFDPSAPVTGWNKSPDVLARTLAGDLKRVDLSPCMFDRVVSAASGSRAGDRLEALVLREVWGEDPLPPILVPKATLGEHGGALLAGAVLAAAGASFAATPGFNEPDPGLSAVPHDGRTLDPPRRVLVSSLAAGGSAAWTVLERENP